MLPQFEAEMAFSNIPGGIGLEFRGKPLPCLNHPAFTQYREKGCGGLIDCWVQIVHICNGNTGAMPGEQIAVGVNVKMGGRLERPTTGIAAELLDRIPPQSFA
jgi:hypothetical protein